MRELHVGVWLGVPLASFGFCLVSTLIDWEFYSDYVRVHEAGYLEQSTVLLLLPAVVAAVWLAWPGRKLPTRWLSVWAVMLGLGALYFAGEEASWGQNYVGWSTPGFWSEINDQQETNIHNVHGVFDSLPRGLLTAGAIACLIFVPVTARPRLQWDLRRDWRASFFPTVAVVPSAILAVTVGIPQKFYGGYGAKDPTIPDWFDAMFLRGCHSELKEHFLAMFIFMYVVSWWWRWRTPRSA